MSRLFKGMTDEEIDNHIKSVVRSASPKGRGTRGWSEKNLMIRRKVILDLIGKGLSYRRIVEELVERWEISIPTIERYYSDAMDYIIGNNENEREKMRDKAIERLEKFMETALESNDKKSYLTASEQLNKICGLYTDKKEVTIKDTEVKFQFDE